MTRHRPPTSAPPSRVFAGLLGLCALVAYLAPTGLDTASLAASPAARKTPFEIVVTLEAAELPRPYLHRISLTRAQFEDVRFSPRKARKKALKKARIALAKKLGYESGAALSNPEKLVNAKVRDIEVFDYSRGSRAGKRTSILRDASIL